MKKLLSQFVRDEDGAAMIEYTVLVGIITAGVIASVIGVGLWVNQKWTALDATLS